MPVEFPKKLSTECSLVKYHSDERDVGDVESDKMIIIVY